jgi:hypothetical protein
MLPIKTSQISLDCFEDIITSNYLINDDEDYNMLCSFIKNYVDADCRAITINDEIIYNSYNSSLTYKEQILENMIRDQIVKQPHRNLLILLNRSEQNGIIRIYMKEEPHLEIIELNFDVERMIYYIQIFNGVFNKE